MKPTHLDLFSGIGGFALAARWAGIETVQFVELDPFCQKVLAKNFPGVSIHDDIKTFRYGGNKCLESAQIVGSEKWQEKESHTANHVTQNGLLFGERQILISEGQGIDRETGIGKIGCSTIMAQDASVVEKQQGNFSPSTTRVTTGTKNGETINHKHGKSLSSGDSLTTIKSFATTATTPKRIAEFAPTRGKNHEVFLLTAGTPCQPASCAGKRRGTSDDRWLWGETFRVIAEVNPEWCILENVRGLLSLEGGVVFDNLLFELESIGYETTTFIIPACAVNAPHRRDRVWIVSQNAQDTLGSRNGGGCDGSSFRGECSLQIAGPNCHASDSSNQGLQGGSKSTTDSGENSRREKSASRSIRQFCDLSNIEQWQEPWLKAATRLCRVDDGVAHRVDRLKALGNGQVPQVVAAAWRVLTGRVLEEGEE